MDIVCFGQQGWHSARTEKQQHSLLLAERGHRVLYVDPHQSDRSLSLVDGLRALAPGSTLFGVEQLTPSLYHFSYTHAPLLRWRLNTWRRERVMRAVASRLGFRRPVVLTLTPHVLPLIEALEPRCVFYYAVDDMSAFGGMSDRQRRRARRREEALLRRSSAAFAVSPRLVERFREIQPRTHLVENGVDPEHFSPSRPDALPPAPRVTVLPRPRLGLVGQIDERVDQALLLALARAHPRGSVVLVGRVKQGVDVSALEAEPNVHLLRFHDYDELPAVLSAFDVCLVPYRPSQLTHACNPSKIFEYVAAGKPVVSTPLDGIGVCRRVIRVASGRDAFLDAVARAVADPEAGREERLSLARENHWRQRNDRLEDLMRVPLEEMQQRAEGAAG